MVSTRLMVTTGIMVSTRYNDYHGSVIGYNGQRREDSRMWEWCVQRVKWK